MADVLINGRPDRQLDWRDRAVQYGDGHFTTVAVRHGQPQLWQRHWQRLQIACQALQLPEPDELKLRAEVLQVSRGHPDCVVKILLSRGTGGRGYTAPEQPKVVRIVSRSPTPRHYPEWREHGVSLGLAQQRLGLQAPPLAGLKTLNRLEQVLIKQELGGSGADDLVVQDVQDRVVEVSAGNLFWREADQWYTPKLTNAGVAGVVRAELLIRNPQVLVGHFSLTALAQAEEALVCNAVLGVAPVHSLLGRPLPTCRSYPEQWHSQLAEELRE